MPQRSGPAADKWPTVADGNGGHFTSQCEARLTACRGWRLVDWPAVCGVASDVPREVTHLAVVDPAAAAGASTSGWRARTCKVERCILKHCTHIARTCMYIARTLHVEIRQQNCSANMQRRILTQTVADRSLQYSPLSLKDRLGMQWTSR